jgi:hypothetical protein
MNTTITETEANKMMAKAAISMLKDSLKIYFSNVHFTYKTSTKDGITTLVITYTGDLDVPSFSNTLDAVETSYLQIFFKRETW